jgi:hypothetical protein
MFYFLYIFDLDSVRYSDVLFSISSIWIQLGRGDVLFSISSISSSLVFPPYRGEGV